MRRAPAALLAAALLLVSACGGGSGGKPLSDRQTISQPSTASTSTQTTATPSVAPGKLHTAAGREIEHVVTDFYTGLENQDTGVLCASITPDARKKVIAIGSIQDAKTCGSAYRKIFDQLSFSYTETPKVVRVTISGSKARATTMFGSHTTKAPLKKVGGAWKVDSIG